MSPTLLLVVYCLLILLSSLAGGWIPLIVRLTHTRIQLAMSFVGGAMLGVGLLHLLPHAFLALESIYPTVVSLLCGFLLMFFIERIFHFHHHDAPAHEESPSQGPSGEHAEHAGHVQHTDQACAHGHHHHNDQAQGRKLSWGAALVGLTLHSTLDGLALGASVAAESRADHPGALAGLVVFLVIFLHKPFDSMTLGTLMAVAHKPARLRHLVNGLYALAIPAGVLLFHLGLGSWGAGDQRLVGYALAFAAGTFLCISTSDLLPELQFHSHDRFKLSGALLLGIALAGAVVALEASHHAHGSHGDHDEHDAESEHDD